MADKEDVLRKVRALIAQADSTTFEGERDTFLKKADQMIAAYAIEQWELEMAKPAGTRVKPEMREYEYGSTGDASIDANLSTLFYTLASHLRCKVGWFGWQKSKIVGFSTDLDYLDLIFTSIRLHLATTVVPRVHPEMSYEENLAVLKEAGYKWQKIYEMLVPHYPDKFKLGELGHLDESYGGVINVDSRRFKRTMPRPIGVRFTKEYTEFCKKNDRQRIYSSPETYRRNFTEAYVYRIQGRLREMNRNNQESSSGKELVLASRQEDMDEFFYEMFPNLKPHPSDCDCDSCHRCSDPKCKRPSCVERRKPVRYRSAPEKKLDLAARDRGREAANRVDLSGGRGLRNTRELSG